MIIYTLLFLGIILAFSYSKNLKKDTHKVILGLGLLSPLAYFLQNNQYLVYNKYFQIDEISLYSQITIIFLTSITAFIVTHKTKKVVTDFVSNIMIVMLVMMINIHYVQIIAITYFILKDDIFIDAKTVSWSSLAGISLLVIHQFFVSEIVYEYVIYFYLTVLICTFIQLIIKKNIHGLLLLPVLLTYLQRNEYIGQNLYLAMLSINTIFIMLEILERVIPTENISQIKFLHKIQSFKRAQLNHFELNFKVKSMNVNEIKAISNPVKKISFIRLSAEYKYFIILALIVITILLS